MNLEYIPDEKFFWWILLLGGVFLLVIFIVWAISQLRNKT